MSPALGTSGSGPPRLDFEIRLPPGATLPANAGAIRIELSTERNSMPGEIFPARTREEENRVVIAGSVELYYRSSWRLLALDMPAGEPSRIFRISLPARPGHMREHGPWQRLDFVADSAGQPQAAPTSGETFEIRYRVVYRDKELEEEAGGGGQ